MHCCVRKATACTERCRGKRHAGSTAGRQSPVGAPTGQGLPSRPAQLPVPAGTAMLHCSAAPRQRTLALWIAARSALYSLTLGRSCRGRPEGEGWRRPAGGQQARQLYSSTQRAALASPSASSGSAAPRLHRPAGQGVERPHLMGRGLGWIAPRLGCKHQSSLRKPPRGGTHRQSTLARLHRRPLRLANRRLCPWGQVQPARAAKVNCCQGGGPATQGGFLRQRRQNDRASRRLGGCRPGRGARRGGDGHGQAPQALCHCSDHAKVAPGPRHRGPADIHGCPRLEHGQANGWEVLGLILLLFAAKCA